MNLKFLVCKSCNLKCNYCHNEFQGDTSGLTYDQQYSFVENKIHSLIEKKLDINKFDLFKISGGEPFLRPKQISLLLKIANEYSKKKIILSNLTIYNSMILETIILMGVNEIRVNLPSFNYKEYSKITGCSRSYFDNIFKNISILQKHNINIRLNIVVSKPIESSLYSYIKTYLEKAISINIFKEVRFIVDERSKNKDVMLYEIFKILSDITSAIGEERRGRIIDFKYNNTIISLSHCVVGNKTSDIYIVPPGVILKNYEMGKAYD